MKTSTVKVITMLAGAVSLLWITGLIWTMNDQFLKNSKPLEKMQVINKEAKNDVNHFKIAALGDSLTRGTGDATGEGYIGHVVKGLKEKTSNKEISLLNMAVKGQTSSQLVNQMQQEEVKRQIAEASIIIMTIGGNDLFRSGEEMESFSAEQIDEAKASYLKNLQTIFSTIRELNKEATVFHVGLYNPFNNLSDARTTSAIVREWNFASAESAANYKKIVFVPTFDLFELNVNDYLYSDKFHPNTEGYQLIGERVAALITFSEGEDTDD